jgi:hypothetical protein
MRLTAPVRKALPTDEFAGPDRSFPIEDPNHARAALSMASNAPNPAAIQAKVHKKFPGIGPAVRSGVMSKLTMGKKGC